MKLNNVVKAYSIIPNNSILGNVFNNKMPASNTIDIMFDENDIIGTNAVRNFTGAY